MVELKLGSESDITLLKNCKSREILGFLEKGVISLNGSVSSLIGLCCCGEKPVYVNVVVYPLKYMYCDVKLEFFCKDCLNRGKNE